MINVENRVNCWNAKAKAKPISSQAKGLKKLLEGSETTERAKAVISARVPCISLRDEDIVRYLGESLRVSLNG